MENVSMVTIQNDKIYQQQEIKKLDRRNEELRLEQQRIKTRLEDNEEKRIMMNRLMNRPGQNIDKIA